ncbi:PAS domain S-box-containing protein [Bacillus ectoiniformans]|nr:PAS domain S-box-containing protein [Bacillus ectoiniformans]
MTSLQERLTDQSTFKQAASIMLKYKWNAVPVTDRENKLIGVFTRTSLYHMIQKELSLDSNIMPYIKTAPVSLPLDTPYEKVIDLVRCSEVGTGVVTNDGNEPVGLITKADVVTALFSETYSLKDQLDTILDTSKLGAVLADDQGNIHFANSRFLQMFGLTNDDLTAVSFYDLFPDADDGSWKRMPTNLGEMFVRYSTYHTRSGGMGFIAILQEVSEGERVAEELQVVKRLKRQLETAINHAYDGIVMTDEKGRILIASPSLCDLFSVSNDEVIGRFVHDIFPELQLMSVLEGGIAEFSEFAELKGIKFAVNRIPVIENNRIIGAIGKVIFRQLYEVRQVFKKLEATENQMNYYKNQLKKTESARYTWDHIISEDEKIIRMKRSAQKAAKGLSTVLIRGESGTGKELFAHAIHSSSARKDKPFITVNCAAIPEHLLESEFFGYEEGAFTGANQKGKIGKFDLANGGTLFLDEIGDMSLPLQAKMLRVLQDKEFYRIGGTKRIHVDVRFIAATNQPLEKLVSEGKFREDLYYRLNVISFQIPSLRERVNDILLLSRHFMEELNGILGTSITGIEPDALSHMIAFHWPGNIRELRNVIERAMTFAEHGMIQKEDLPEYMIQSLRNETRADSKQSGDLMETAEKQAIAEALVQTNGNKSKAAELLGISRSSLYEKMKKLNV